MDMQTGVLHSLVKIFKTIPVRAIKQSAGSIIPAKTSISEIGPFLIGSISQRIGVHIFFDTLVAEIKR